MDKQSVSETWFYYGICDLYLSSHNDDSAFYDSNAFSAIMGLEKHLKAFLIFQRENEFSSLPDNEAKIKIEKIAKKYGHDFEDMISACGEFLKPGKLNKILDRDYDGYNGKDLSNALKDCYMETRYPTPMRVATQFPLVTPGTYHDPLSSSGLHIFIFKVCEFIFLELASELDTEKLLNKVSVQYKHLEPFNRFTNLYLNGWWK